MEPVIQQVELNSTEEFDPLADAMQIIGLKNLLIIAKQIDLVGDHSSPEDYGWFIDTLNITLGEEEAFFLLNEDFLKSAEDVLFSKRFEYQQLESYNDVINEIIGKLNSLHNLSDYDKAVKAKNYILWNLDVRRLPLNLSQADLYRTLAYDALVLESVMDGEIPEIPAAFTVASTNYLAETIPEFYETYPLARETTMSFLEAESKKRGFWNRGERKAAQEATKKFQKIKTKEE